MEKDEESVSFTIIEKVPIFPGCKGETNAILKDCMNNNIRKHISVNFNARKAQKSGLKGKQHIYVKFKILKTGKVKIEKVKAPNRKLENEARRVVNKLPKMIPGEQKGKPVNVTYMLPIIFSL
jgi:protein TonB